MVNKKFILLNKKEGETPLQALENFRAKNKKYKDIKMTYAGRLDPIAEGLLLILAGEEVKNKEKYLKLDKVYEFEVLFGFATDTYDILGKITKSLIRSNRRIELEDKINKNLKHFRGRFLQKYPLYSSKTWEKARAGEKIEAEEREVNVKSLKFLGLHKINNKQLFKLIEKRIKKVKGDFRQKEILHTWHTLLRTSTWKQAYVGSFKIKCSSGTYVRSIANSLGEKIGVPALAYSIKRTQIGKYRVRV